MYSWQAFSPSIASRYSKGPLSAPLRATCTAAPWAKPLSRNSLQAQGFTTDQPLHLPLSLPGFLPAHFYIHLLNKLLSKYLLRAILLKMLWAKRYRKLTQNFVNNEENYYFLLQNIQALARALRLCFSGIHLALSSSVCCHCPRATDRATSNNGAICFLGYS